MKYALNVVRDVAVTIITKTTVNGGQTIHGSLVFAVHYTR